MASSSCADALSTATAALSISGCRTSAWACRLAASSGRVRRGSPSGRSSIGSSSASLRARRARSLMSLAVCSKALSAAIDGLVGGLEVRAGRSPRRGGGCAATASIWARSCSAAAKRFMRCRSSPARTVSSPSKASTERRARLELLVAAFHLGLGGGQLALERRRRGPRWRPARCGCSSWPRSTGASSGSGSGCSSR